MRGETSRHAGAESFEGLGWSAWLAARIEDPALCPICMRPALLDARCQHCAVDLRGETGVGIWRASQAAASALNHREQLMRAALGRTESLDTPLPSPASARVPQKPDAASQRHSTSPNQSIPRANTTLQTMFALAGAGLVAVAAIVFTFFNPDLDDRVLRSAIVAVVTLWFLGAAWWLAARGSASSAEAVGGLAAVFVAIDVWALAQPANDGSGAWFLAASATFICAAAALLLSARVGLRSWSFAAMLGFALVPAMLGYAGGAQLQGALGQLGVVIVIVVQQEWFPKLARRGPAAAASRLLLPRIPAAGRPEHILFSALQILAALSTIPSLGVGLLHGEGAGVGALLLGFAVAAVFAARHGARIFWSLVAGASGASVLPALAFDAFLLDSWHLTLVTAGAAVGAVIVVAVASRLRSVSIPQFSYAAITVPAVFSLPTMLFLSAMLASSPQPNDPFSPGLDIPWTFVTNALILSAGAAMCVRVAGTSAKTHASMRALIGLCSVMAVVFALLAAFLVARLLLDLAGLGGVALESIVTSCGLALGVAVTLTHRVPVLVWRTVLAVGAVPFVASVVTVFAERSGWTALATISMCGLALALLMTKRPGLGAFLRSAAAALVMPSLAVSLICLGAQVLDGSASPSVLPLIAAVIAVALAASTRFFALVPTHARPARVAFEASVLLTAAITVLLSLTRDAAGVGTACIVLLLLGLGMALHAHFGARRYAWWLAGVSLTGALWCALGLAQVPVPVLEAYLLPPALVASLLGVLLSARGSRQTALYSVGLGVAVVPTLVLLAGGAEISMARATGLLVASWLLLAVAKLLLRHPRVSKPGADDDRAPVSNPDRAGSRTPIGALGVVTLLASMTSGLAGAVSAARLGAEGAPFAGCLAVSAVGAGAMLLAGTGLRAAVARFDGVRWLEAPAVIALAAGCWWAIDRNWVDILSMWGLMSAYLVAMVIVSRRQLSGRGPLLPALLLFAIALVTAIVAWSPRELRVDVFSLPLGLMLTLAGALALRHQRRLARRSGLGAGPGRAVQGDASDGTSLGGWLAISRWPLGQHGSWPLLGPGITVTVLASIVATFTDPQTWRAILVMVIALIAMLLGARLRLAAPFVLGLIVLPIENVFVFAVQIGRGIDSMPWWITLATIGAVLLSISVVSERRSGGEQGLMARMRDLK